MRSFWARREGGRPPAAGPAGQGGLREVQGGPRAEEELQGGCVGSTLLASRRVESGHQGDGGAGMQVVISAIEPSLGELS